MTAESRSFAQLAGNKAVDASPAFSSGSLASGSFSAGSFSAGSFSAGSGAELRPASALFDRLRVRLARPDDLEGLLGLAHLAGPGFSSLPTDPDFLARRLAGVGSAATGDYLLVLEDQPESKGQESKRQEPNARLVGCAGIKARSGMGDGFFNLQIEPIPEKGDPEAIVSDAVLRPTDRYKGMSEVGSLFLHPDYRKPGVGRFLALSRYVMVAQGPEAFSPILWSELRGLVGEDGFTPFYEYVTKRYLNMTFDEADRRFATKVEGGLRELLPDSIAVSGLSEQARRVMARTHAHGGGALRLLKSVGFRFEGVIDVLDGGPLVACPRDQVLPVRASNLATALVADPEPDGRKGQHKKGLAGRATEAVMLASGRPDSFRALRAEIATDILEAFDRLEEGVRSIPLTESQFRRLAVAPGDDIRVFRLDARD